MNYYQISQFLFAWLFRTFKQSSVIFTFLSFMLILNVEPIAAQVHIIDVNISIVDDPQSQQSGVCNLIVSDTLNCSLVSIELIDGIIDSVVFQHDFVFDQTEELPENLSWFRNQDQIVLGLGLLPNCVHWKARIRLRDSNANWTAWDEFLFN